MEINIACVDDETTVLRSIKRVFHDKVHKYDNFPKETFHTYVETYSSFDAVQNAQKIDLLLLDVNLEEFGSTKESKRVLNHVRHKFPNAVILMYSGSTEDNLVIDYLLCGADNFLSKEIPKENLPIPLIQTYKNALRKREVYQEKAFNFEDYNFVGHTARKVLFRVNDIVPFRSIRSILVTGETGTGKEIVADIVQQVANGHAGKKIPFERFDCGAITDSLLESELFGSVKGAFTGATDKIGLFEKANGGWIFLDEIASLTPSAQNAIMRVIENNEIRRVGSNAVKKIDVRVISATNFDLEQLSKEGRFRHDLIPRLRAAHIHLPPLREREKQEKEELIQYFANHNPDGYNVQFDPIALKILQSYDWKLGNIREMRDLIATMLPLASTNGTLYADCIPRYILNALSTIKIPNESFTDPNATPDNFSITLELNQESCQKKNLEKIVFSRIFELFKSELNLQEIGKVFGVSHNTVIDLAKRCEAEGLISFDGFNKYRKKTDDD